MLGPPLSPGGPNEAVGDIARHTIFVPLLVIKIGSFTKSSMFCGDLVANFSFGEGRVYWELFSVSTLYRVRPKMNTIGDGYE